MTPERPLPTSPRSCVLVGETALLVQCRDLLVRRGYTVVGVVSEDPLVRRRLAADGVPVCSRIEQAPAFLAERTFDYLFSVVNPYLIDAATLGQARRAAINYHDSRLPRFSGSHAVPWALILGEPQTGVSWHLMGDRADAGEILAQTAVPISPQDTAESLNTRCGMAALATFGQLLKSLNQDRPPTRPQDPAQRTFFYRFRRPTPAAVVDFDRPAEELVRLVRGLSFGAQLNALGLPKMFLDGQLLLIERARATGDRSGAPPGQVLARPRPGCLVVATGSGELEVAVRPLRTAGRCSAPSDPERWRTLEAFDRSAFAHERHWLNIFRDHPHLLADRPPRQGTGRRQPLSAGPLGRDQAYQRLAQILGRLAARADVDRLCLWHPPDPTPPSLALTGLYPTAVPLAPEATADRELLSGAGLRNHHQQNLARRTYLADLTERLRGSATPPPAGAISIWLSFDSASPPPTALHDLELYFPGDGPAAAVGSGRWSDPPLLRQLAVSENRVEVAHV